MDILCADIQLTSDTAPQRAHNTQSSMDAWCLQRAGDVTSNRVTTRSHPTELRGAKPMQRPLRASSCRGTNERKGFGAVQTVSRANFITSRQKRKHRQHKPETEWRCSACRLSSCCALHRDASKTEVQPKRQTNASRLFTNKNDQFRSLRSRKPVDKDNEQSIDDSSSDRCK